ncbi:MAG: hypothetical protein GTO24_17310, partial [candidate division Zixibacteria bacterium]|nr:hypothetical protein [candidate division Zixibacteria bacterium]
GIVLTAYLDLVEGGNRQPSPKEIAEKANQETQRYRPVSDKWVGRKLEALKLKRGRIGKGRYVIFDPERIRKLKKRYGLHRE